MGFQPLPAAQVDRVFRDLDSNADGYLDMREFQAALEVLRVPYREWEAEELMDPAKPMTLHTFRRFVALQETKLHSIFLESDVDHSGTLELAEVVETMKRFNKNVTQEDARHVLERLDRDHDACVTFEEFREALLLVPPARVAAVFEYWARHCLDIGEVAMPPPPTPNWRTFVAGAVAGVVSRTCTAPLDRVKMLLQASSGASQGLVAELRRIHREGGWRAFWRGNGANVVKIAPEYGIRFWAYDTVKRRIAVDPQHTTMLEKFTAGATAGIVAESAIFPLETVRTRLAVGFSGMYAGILDCARKLVRAEGIRGLYRGFVPAVVGIVPFCGMDLAMYHTLREAYVRRYPTTPPGPLILLGCGAASSSCAQVVAYPLALIRTRLQAQGTPGVEDYAGPVDCFRRTVRHSGVRGLYRGLGANFLKLLPAVGISYATYEETLRRLEP